MLTKSKGLCKQKRRSPLHRLNGRRKAVILTFAGGEVFSPTHMSSGKRIDFISAARGGNSARLHPSASLSLQTESTAFAVLLLYFGQ